MSVWVARRLGWVKKELQQKKTYGNRPIGGFEIVVVVELAAVKYRSRSSSPPFCRWSTVVARLAIDLDTAETRRIRTKL
jgi:hypothetical protein